MEALQSPFLLSLSVETWVVLGFSLRTIWCSGITTFRPLQTQDGGGYLDSDSLATVGICWNVNADFKQAVHVYHK